jgi:hypothetical protein
LVKRVGDRHPSDLVARPPPVEFTFDTEAARQDRKSVRQLTELMSDVVSIAIPHEHESRYELTLGHTRVPDAAVTHL